MTESPRNAEVMRLLERYLVEVVERYDLCPWARSARRNQEISVEILWGTPTDEAWIAAATALLARPTTRVAMVIAPELAVTPSELRDIRGRVGLRISSAGIADFHPDAPLDLGNPGRLVPFVRRAPDPLLQLVPFKLLDSVRGNSSDATIATQAQMLGGYVPPPRPDPADRIAEANHATVMLARDELVATFADIARDRAVSYVRVGIRTDLAAGS